MTDQNSSTPEKLPREKQNSNALPRLLSQIDKNERLKAKLTTDPRKNAQQIEETNRKIAELEDALEEYIIWQDKQTNNFSQYAHLFSDVASSELKTTEHVDPLGTIAQTNNKGVNESGHIHVESECDVKNVTEHPSNSSTEVDKLPKSSSTTIQNSEMTPITKEIEVAQCDNPHVPINMDAIAKTFERCKLDPELVIKQIQDGTVKVEGVSTVNPTDVYQSLELGRGTSVGDKLSELPSSIAHKSTAPGSNKTIHIPNARVRKIAKRGVIGVRMRGCTSLGILKKVDSPVQHAPNVPNSRPMKRAINDAVTDGIAHIKKSMGETPSKKRKLASNLSTSPKIGKVVNVNGFSSENALPFSVFNFPFYSNNFFFESSKVQAKDLGQEDLSVVGDAEGTVKAKPRLSMRPYNRLFLI